MATTIDDIEISNTEYVNINTLSSIADDVDILVSNKSTSILRIQISDTQPSSDSTNGDLVGVFPSTVYQKYITDEDSAKWMISDGSVAYISVQEL